MAKTPNKEHLPKNHRIGSREDESADRLIHRADEENWRFYNEAQQYARNVSIIQTGINEQTANALTQGVAAPDAVQEAVKAERVTSELYRAVQGNEYYETNGVPDPSLRANGLVGASDNKNYLNSENQDFLGGTFLNRRLGQRWSRMWRGAASVLGVNNSIEAAMENRFGPNNAAGRMMLARRNFVANRIGPVLTNMAATNVAGLNNVAAGFLYPAYIPPAAVAPYVAGLIPLLAAANLEQLRNVLPDLNDQPVFADLMLLVDIDQRETVKTGIEGVYEPERLRRFWDDRLAASPEEQQMLTTIEGILVENSLFPLKEKPEAMALMGDLENMFNMNVNAGIAPDVVATQITAMLQNIQQNELPEGVQTPANTTRINSINTAATGIRQNIQNVTNSYTRLQALSNDINNAQNVRLPAATTDVQRNQIQAEITNLERERREQKVLLNTAQDALQNECRNINNLLNGIAGAPILIFVDIAAEAKITDNEMNNPPIPPNPDPPLFGFLTDPLNITASDQALNTNLAGSVQALIRVLQARQRATPFVLLQRLIRRGYCQNRNINPAIFSEESEEQSAIQTSRRVADAKNADLYRSANNRAAEYLESGRTGRGIDAVRSAVARGQNFVGLEPINIEQQPADLMIEALVNDRPEFEPFRGIDKFSTPRDIREKLNNSNMQVSNEVLERFIQMLEEVISGYKKGEKNSKKYVIKGDWDLENLIINLQNFKTELWTRETLARLEREGGTGNRGQAFVKMLQDMRAMEQQVAKEICKDVQSAEAMWKKLLVKNDLKKILNKETHDAQVKMKNEGISAKQKQISRLNAQMTGLADGSPEKTRLTTEIANLQKDIDSTRTLISNDEDLYDRVENAKKYIEDNKLSRSATKAYVKEVGLAGVWDKMGMNFRLQRYWKNIKSATKATGRGIKNGWDWSRRHFINAETGRKGVSVGRLLMTPITWPAEKAYKIGTYPFRLAGRAMLGTARVPGRLYRMMNNKAMSEYLREKPAELTFEFEDLVTEIDELNEKARVAPYRRDKKRIARQIVQLELQIDEIMHEYAELKEVAAKRKLQISPMGAGGKKAEKAVDKPAVVPVIATPTNVVPIRPATNNKPRINKRAA